MNKFLSKLNCFFIPQSVEEECLKLTYFITTTWRQLQTALKQHKVQRLKLIIFLRECVFSCYCCFKLYHELCKENIEHENSRRFWNIKLACNKREFVFFFTSPSFSSTSTERKGPLYGSQYKRNNFFLHWATFFRYKWSNFRAKITSLRKRKSFLQKYVFFHFLRDLAAAKNEISRLNEKNSDHILRYFRKT